MPKNVALIFGGRSSEHGISCVTAGNIMRHIDRERYRVIPIGITREGRFIRVKDDPDHWQIINNKSPEVPPTGDEIIIQPPEVPNGASTLRVLNDSKLQELEKVDVFFPLLHGPYGEDGTIQGFLDLFSLPYVGSGVFASAAAQDKDFSKRLLTQAGISVARGIVIHFDEYQQQQKKTAFINEVAKLSPPLFVKPARAGSSFGVSKINGLAELEAAMQKAFAYDVKVLVEAGVTGREVECAVLSKVSGYEVMVSEPGEVVIGSDLDFYDYESKYFGKGNVEIQIPAKLTSAQNAEVKRIAKAAFEALGLEGLARVDVFVGDEIVVNEVNTMPGFTTVSMYPMLWQNMGLEYRELISHLLEHALHKRKGLR